MSKKCTPTKKSQKECELLTLDTIRNQQKPASLWKKKTLTKRQVDYALTKLKRAGDVKKVGYGTWEIVQEYEKQKNSQKEHGVASTCMHKEVTKKELQSAKSKGTLNHVMSGDSNVRMHGVVATLKLPKDLRGWKNRKSVLDGMSVKHKSIPQGQSLFIDDVKIWLTDKSIVFYLPHSWFSDTAQGAAMQCFDYLLKLVRKVEQYLKVSSFKINGHYYLKFCRSHYALIRNELAKQYAKEKKKLFIYDVDGLWLVIDNSFNLHELETVHPRKSLRDNGKVDDAFNSIRAGVTPQFLLDQIAAVTANQEMFNKNFQSHVAAINALEKGVERLTDVVDKSKPPEEEKPEESIEIIITKDTPEFLGTYRGYARRYRELPKGAIIWLERTTAQTLIKNGYARERNLWQGFAR